MSITIGEEGKMVVVIEQTEDNKLILLGIFENVAIASKNFLPDKTYITYDFELNHCYAEELT